MSNGPFKHRLTALFCALLLLSGCRWDQDEAYALDATPHCWLRTESAAGADIAFLRNGLLQAGWLARTGISPTGLADVQEREGYLWLSDASSHSIVVWDLAQDRLKDRFSTAEFTPHHLSVGREYCFVSDSSSPTALFLRKRDGKLFRNPILRHPGRSVYNNGKFYVQMDRTNLSIFNEKAQAEYKQFSLGHPITGLVLDKGRSCHVQMQDTAQWYCLVEANGDYLFIHPTAAYYEAWAPSPYFAQQYGTEYLYEVIVRNGVFTSPAWSDSTEAFTADFFRGWILYQRGDSLYSRNLNTGEKGSTWHMPERLRGGFHYLGTQD